MMIINHKRDILRFFIGINIYEISIVNSSFYILNAL